MKILRLFDSLKFVRAMFVAVVCMFAIMPAHAATLPAGYTELEYIEGRGTQYIDTGITDVVNLKTELVAQLTSINTSTSSYPSLIGASGSSSQEGSFNDLKQTYPNLNFINAKRLTGNESKEELINWIN